MSLQIIDFGTDEEGHPITEECFIDDRTAAQRFNEAAWRLVAGYSRSFRMNSDQVEYLKHANPKYRS